MNEDKFREEVLRINSRYLVEIVEQYDFCPWAKKVRGTSRFRREIFLADANGETLRNNVAAMVEEIAAQTEIEIALLIFPRLKLNSREFRSFGSSAESIHAKAHPRGELPLAMASFHPDAEADLNSPARLVPFIRRSPDPTIQLVRRSTMAKVGSSSSQSDKVFAESLEAFLPLMGTTPKPSLSESIAKTNLDTVESVSVAHIESILKDIASDRARAYKDCA